MEGTEQTLADRLGSGLGDDYTLEGEIGRGGMGVVFLARDEKLKRRVAIKALPPDLAFREDIRTRFLREAETAARLSHPHIVPIFNVGETNGIVYFVMAFVDGEPLGGKLRRRRKLPAEEVRRVMIQTADALSGAHAVGIIHRDVKPDNILLEGTRGRVMVTDFGIAKALTDAGGSATLTGTGVALGTPAYMSPEQAAGERDIDHRSDLYSLGVVAYQALTGELPFRAPTVPKLLLKQITEPAPSVQLKCPDCPDDLAASIERCLEKDPEDRWATADALRRALEHRTAVPAKPRRSSARRPLPAARPRRSLDEALDRAGNRLENAWSDLDSQLAARRRARARGSRYAPQRRGDARPGKSVEKAGEPEAVARFRNNFASWASVSGGLMLLNVATGLGEPWFLWVALPWAGIGLFPRYLRLWQKGYSWRDVVSRPPAPDAIEALASGKKAALPAEDGDLSTGEFGTFAGQIRQAHSDREGILRMLGKLSTSERDMLPEIEPTVDSLYKRAEELARTLAQMGNVEQEQLETIKQKISDLSASDSADERRLSLLERQQASVMELLDRREKVEAQFESCLLAIQNVRLDLLRLRSAGVSAVVDDLTMATQQARVLAEDIDVAISAAHELRRALRR